MGSNHSDLLRVAPPGSKDKVALFRAHDPDEPGADVPDPYYGGPDGFARVVDIVEANSRIWLHRLR